MTATEFAVRVVVIGLVALDPLGAIVALAGITVGARRRALSALLIGYVVAMSAFGILGTLLARTVGRTTWAEDAARFVGVHHLVAYGEAAVGAALLLWGIVALVRRVRRPARSSAEKAPRWLDRFSARLATPSGMAAAGAAVAVTMLVDPGFPALAVVARDQPVWQWVPAWVVWCAISQCMLVVLWAAALADRRGDRLERTGRAVRSAIARSGAALSLLLVVLGAALLLDAGLTLR